MSCVPLQVSSYKGEKQTSQYKRKSHLESMKLGTPSQLYTTDVLYDFNTRLEAQWEKRAGFKYDGVLL